MGRYIRARPGRIARELAWLCIAAAAGAGLARAADAPVTWPPGWTVEQQADGLERARPGDTGRVFIDFVTRPAAPAFALHEAALRFSAASLAAGFQSADCGDPAPVPLGAGNGIGEGCTATRSGLPVLKASLVAWPLRGNTAAVLSYMAPPGAFEAYLDTFGAVVRSARVP